MKQDYPILEYDPAREAILEPNRILKRMDIAERCVLCFFQDVITGHHRARRLRSVHHLGWELGDIIIYDMVVEGKSLTVVHPGVGAPLAVGVMEELIALGCRKFIACGGCGVLDGRVGLGDAMIVSSAVRDEGTSYHYLPPGREIEPSAAAIAALRSAAEARQVSFIEGKTWTTDAPYRETAAKVALRREEGCLTVEMEAAAFCAVAAFRSVTFGQVLYGGDDLSGDEWDERGWQRLNSTREKLFQLAVEACLRL
jgi:uridine phosphorylase